MIKGKLAYDLWRPSDALNAKLPASARRKADNVNHLMEQPTLCYAESLALAWHRRRPECDALPESMSACGSP